MCLADLVTQLRSASQRGQGGTDPENIISIRLWRGHLVWAQEVSL